VVQEGLDDSRMDLAQMEDGGTGRSVPTTPLQVSPAADLPPSVKDLYFYTNFDDISHSRKLQVNKYSNFLKLRKKYTPYFFIYSAFFFSFSAFKVLSKSCEQQLLIFVIFIATD